MTPSKFLSLFVLAIGCSTAACSGQSAAEEGGTTEGAISFTVNPGKFKLYSEPGHQSDAACDVFTALELKSTGINEGSGTFVDAFEGTCVGVAPPFPRTFQLDLDLGPCGVRTYRGESGDRSVKISDYRLATCVRVVSQLVVEETSKSGGWTTTKYAAADEPASGPIVCLAIPTCDEGHDQVESSSACLQDDAVCYSRTECGRTIWCTGPAAAAK
jgi:hypothetical protein